MHSLHSWMFSVVGIIAILTPLLVRFWQWQSDTLRTMWASNPYLQAIVVPMCLGACVHLLHVLGTSIYIFALSKVSCSVFIKSTETECFDAVLEYILEQQEVQCTQLMVSLKKKIKNRKETIQEELTGISTGLILNFLPANMVIRMIDYRKTMLTHSLSPNTGRDVEFSMARTQNHGVKNVRSYRHRGFG